MRTTITPRASRAFHRGQRGPALAALAAAIALLFVSVPGTAASMAPGDERLFTQTGFRVDRESFWDFFQKRGGVRTFGYPVSADFSFMGCTTQFFQRVVLQQCGAQGVGTLNLLDAGLLPYTRINGSTFPAIDPAVTGKAPAASDPGYSTKVIEFVRANAPDTFEGERVNFFNTFQNTVKLTDAFPSGDGDPSLLPLLNLELWGLPTSKPQRDPTNGNFIYQRFQRGIMHYDKTCGCTQGLLLADYLKAVLTGQNLPADLEAQAKGGALYRSASTGKPPAGTVFGKAFLSANSAQQEGTTVAASVPVSAADQRKFIEDVAAVARRLRSEVGLPPSLVIAMAINESGWGRSELSKKANNYFGVKALRGEGTVGSMLFDTWEVVDGKVVQVKAPFRAYRSLEESVRDLGAFLRAAPRYAAVWKQGGDPVATARAMHTAGYGTDPAWTDKLARIIEAHGLRRFDAN